MTPIAELRERLLRQVDTGQRTVGGGAICHGGVARTWGGEPIMRPANEDGADALAAIDALQAEIDRLTGERDAIIEQCAKVCDDAFGDTHPSELAAQIRALSQTGRG